MLARKIMCAVFWDRKGVLLVDCLPRGIKWNIRRGMLGKGVFLLHDNARPRAANQTQDLNPTSFSWEQLDHPPYSGDIAPSNYHLFL